MQVGDEVRSANGEWTQIASIKREGRSEKVYNFQVADNHNYFVGQQGALVHNSCFEVLERTDDVIYGHLKTTKGDVEIMANIAKTPDVVTLSKVHVGGLNPGSLMPKEVKALQKLFAEQIANLEGVKQVIIEPGIRLGGAKAKRGIFETPPPIIFNF